MENIAENLSLRSIKNVTLDSPSYKSLSWAATYSAVYYLNYKI